MKQFTSVVGVVTRIVAGIAILLSGSSCANRKDEVVFYEYSQFEGDKLFVSLARGCYNMENDWNNRISSVDTQGHCIIVWDYPDCRGPSVELAPGVRGLGSLSYLKFDDSISAISVCPGDSGLGDNERPPVRQSDNMNGNQLDIWKVGLEEHNKYRRLHRVPALQGDTNIHNAAQAHADYLAKNNRFEVSSSTRFGENLATSYKTSKLDAIRDVVSRWYDKIEHYDFRNPESNKSRPKSGQFSSIVWRSTTHLGIGVSWNDIDHKWVVVAFYDPPATQSQYAENVLPPRRR